MRHLDELQVKRSKIEEEKKSPPSLWKLENSN